MRFVYVVQATVRGKSLRRPRVNYGSNRQLALGSFRRAALVGWKPRLMRIARADEK
jgi:hypothetical protein